MKNLLMAVMAGCLLAAGAAVAAGEPSVTVYNGGFAVVRETIPLNLTRGVNTVSTTGITAFLEPNSVILRDPAGKYDLRVLEQNYRSDPVSPQLLLSRYEGETLAFLVQTGERTETKVGRIIRSGYVPHPQAWGRYGQEYRQRQMAYAYEQRGANEPLIEMDGTLRFGLPGQPLFPALTGEDILQPTLDWTLASDRAGTCAAELAYLTGGMSWSADYNIIAPERGNTMDLIGWITLDNQSGRTFTDARLKLMAGEVSKLTNPELYNMMMMDGIGGEYDGDGPQVTEKAFDEYHLYTLERPTTLRDRETKQVEFLRVPGIATRQLYVYDGMKNDPQYRHWSQSDIRRNEQYGRTSNPDVWVMREFANSEANRLGMSLPAGRMRFYRRDGDGQLEFTGENVIDHTPKDETVRVYTGNAFDLVGERRQTQFQYDHQSDRWLDESFEITLRNHKAEAAEIRVVEHLNRWSNWSVTRKTAEYRKLDSRTIEFIVTVPPNGERVIAYTAHYDW